MKTIEFKNDSEKKEYLEKLSQKTDKVEDVYYISIISIVILFMVLLIISLMMKGFSLSTWLSIVSVTLPVPVLLLILTNSMIRKLSRVSSEMDFNKQD